MAQRPKTLPNKPVQGRQPAKQDILPSRSGRKMPVPFKTKNPAQVKKS